MSVSHPECGKMLRGNKKQKRWRTGQEYQAFSVPTGFQSMAHTGRRWKHWLAACLGCNSPFLNSLFPFSEGASRFTAWPQQQIIAGTRLCGNEKYSLHYNWQVAVAGSVFDQKAADWIPAGKKRVYNKTEMSNNLRLTLARRNSQDVADILK